MTADSQALRDLSKQIDAALIDIVTGDDDSGGLRWLVAA